MQKEQCRVCRRVGQKLFLKGDRCFSPKCALLKRAFPPGPESKKKRSAASGYKIALIEKQKLKNWYGLREYQFKAYVKGVLAERGKIDDIANELIKRLELRLDSTIFHMGFAKSRVTARQLVNHGFFLINKKAIDIPSFAVKKDDVITIKESKKGKGIFKDIATQLKTRAIPTWIELNKETLVGKMKGEPTLAEILPPAEVSVIFEYYSR